MKMTKVRKLFAFTLAAGLIMSSMTAFAVSKDQWPTQFPGTYAGGGLTSEYKGGTFYYHFYGSEPGSCELRGADGYLWSAENGNDYEWDETNGSWVLISGSSSSGSSHKSAAEKEAQERKKAEEAAEREAQERANREALEQKREAEEEGFNNVEDMLDADSRDMSSAEWNNNAVLDTPGMDVSVPVSAGQGSVVIDGEKTNITPTIEKADAAFADSIKREKDGLLLNVFQVSYPSTDDAEITFDLSGVNASSKIAVYQYVNGVWTEVEVTEIRKDHVTLHLQGDGVVAFMLEAVTLTWEGVTLPLEEEEALASAECGDTITAPEKQPVETPVEEPVEVPVEEPDEDKKDDKTDASEKQPVTEKIIHYVCYGCGADFTDKDAFKQHALEGARKGEIHNYFERVEEVEVYE